MVFDPSVVRGLAYYTGPVFEAELTFQVTDDKGRVRNFGSVAGGGRYDGLIKRFTGSEVPATGCASGVDRLLAALHATDRVSAEWTGPVVVTTLSRRSGPQYQAIVAELRAAGIRAEMYLGKPGGMGRQMKYADRRDAPLVIIAGSEEFERGVLQVKDLRLGRELSAGIADRETWRTERPAQFEVARTDLVARVKNSDPVRCQRPPL